MTDAELIEKMEAESVVLLKAFEYVGAETMHAGVERIKSLKQATELKRWGDEKPDVGTVFFVYVCGSESPIFLKMLDSGPSMPGLGFAIRPAPTTSLEDDCMWSVAPAPPDWNEVTK